MTEKACGIICEYNPFHNGHKYQIEYVKENLGLQVVCAMSGAFVQRGTAAFADKYVRARTAAENGAEIVLEIPFPFSSMTAERFARAGIAVLDGCGMCSHVAFGSECADTGKLSEIAGFLLSESSAESIRAYQKENPNISYAAARSRAIAEALGAEYAEISENPNDILAIEYIKAIKTLGSGLVPVAVKRTVDRTELPNGKYASSSHIRRLISEGNAEKAEKFVPNGTDLADICSENPAFYELVRIALMTKTPEQLSEICEISGGLEYALIRTAKESESYSEMCGKMPSKTLTDAKVRRMALFAFFGVTKVQAEELPAYTSVLAMNDGETARRLMRVCRKEKKIIVAQRASAVNSDKSAKRQYDFSRNAENILLKMRNFKLSD